MDSSTQQQDPATGAPPGTPSQVATFVARQPIFDRRLKVYGYELLFRSALTDAFDAADGDVASGKVLADGFLVLGIERLTSGRLAFINATEQILLGDYPHLFPKRRLVVEILETVEPTPEVVQACKRLKQAGYRLALDDVIDLEQSGELLDLADIVKVDVLEVSPERHAELVRTLLEAGKRLVAEKVETQQVYEETRSLGYHYFQGYFFARPKTLSSPDLPAYKKHQLQILKEIHQAELDFDRIESIFKHEPSLCYKLLRYLNSAFFSWRTDVGSIRRALILLGELEFKRWASLILLSSICVDKPQEFLLHSVIRGRFCENLAPAAGLSARAADLFLMGLLSTIDAVLERPLESILAELPIDPDIKAALNGEGGPLRPVFQYAVAHELGDWGATGRRASALGLAEGEIPGMYLDAVEWAAESVTHAGLGS